MAGDRVLRVISLKGRILNLLISLPNLPLWLITLDLYRHLTIKTSHTIKGWAKMEPGCNLPEQERQAVKMAVIHTKASALQLLLKKSYAGLGTRDKQSNSSSHLGETERFLPSAMRWLRLIKTLATLNPLKCSINKILVFPKILKRSEAERQK